MGLRQAFIKSNLRDGRSPRNQTNTQNNRCWLRVEFPTGTCLHCGKTNHRSADCPYKEAICWYCQKLGHLEAVCLTKKRHTQPVKTISKHLIQTVKIIEAVPQLEQTVQIQRKQFCFQSGHRRWGRLLLHGC